ncbi:unnamed protein product [Bemisia tabaci]|uniref:Uncharacterized protein n=1 Tax=Bemisia tabaci TaxID=7038 RepID=A0A9P0EWB0_BEMTA|nr:PREDICTED: ribonuclease UK114-like [Bemisia tabaci]CAH0381509.1 unnamed protein product [Bemisia tabaci]
MAAVRKIIQSAAAPKPVGPYNQAVLSGNTLYISGVLGLNPSSGKLVAGGAKEQATQIFKNMSEILKEAGGDFKNVVKTTILLADMGDFSTINAVYSENFKEPYPARSTFQVAKLPLEAQVEIEAIAHI